MPSTLATITIPHASGERVAVQFACDFTSQEIHSATPELCDPREIEDHHDEAGLLSWADMMFRCAPRVYDDLLEECRSRHANGESY